MAGGVWLRLRLFRDYITIAVIMLIIAYNPTAASTREWQLRTWREVRHTDIIALTGQGDGELVHGASGPPDVCAELPPPPGRTRAARGSAGHGSGRSLERRRAVPPWGLKAEATKPNTRLAVHGNVQTDDDTKGAGATNVYTLRTPGIHKKFMQTLVKIRRTALLSITWSCSWRKANGKQGAKVFRTLQTFDDTSKAWAAAAARKRGRYKDASWLPFWVYGFVEAKSREETVAVQLALAWRAKDFGRSSAVSLYDAINAYGCTSRDGMLARINRYRCKLEYKTDKESIEEAEECKFEIGLDVWVPSPEGIQHAQLKMSAVELETLPQGGRMERQLAKLLEKLSSSNGDRPTRGFKEQAAAA